MELPKQIDNIRELVVDDLRDRLSGHSRVSIAAASFSIYAFEALKKEFEGMEELRFIFTSPTFVKDGGGKEKREYYIPKLNRERSLYGTEFEIRLRNQLSQKAIARECAGGETHRAADGTQLRGQGSETGGGAAQPPAERNDKTIKV